MSSSIALFINLALVAIYGYSIYFINFDPNIKKVRLITPEPLRPYGQLKFLTYQCLLMQFVNANLHVLAHFVRPIRKLRDVWFTALAYPTGSIVVYSFWGVWFTMGRELIFPAALSQYYPDWLNHATHTIIAPINILMAILVQHNYGRKIFFINALYFAAYTALLYYIKMQSGLFVYPYLETMTGPVRAVYFLCTGVFGYLMIRTGNLIENIFHKNSSQFQTPVKKTKQR